MCLCCLEGYIRVMLTKELVNKRNLMLILILCHIAVIIALLALTLARRVYLAMLVNLALLISLLLGLLIYSKLNAKFGLYFLSMITTIIVLALSVMFIEAFALYDKFNDSRAWVFYVNIPIIIDIGFVIAFWVIHFMHLKPGLERLEE